jgi:serine/threonine protein kinase
VSGKKRRKVAASARRLLCCARGGGDGGSGGGKDGCCCRKKSSKKSGNKNSVEHRTEANLLEMGTLGGAAATAVADPACSGSGGGGADKRGKVTKMATNQPQLSFPHAMFPKLDLRHHFLEVGSNDSADFSNHNHCSKDSKNEKNGNGKSNNDANSHAAPGARSAHSGNPRSTSQQDNHRHHRQQQQLGAVLASFSATSASAPIAASALRLKHVIGTGASGCVHAAAYYGQEVAAKELILAPLGARERREAFAQAAAEVRTLAALHHPAVVRLIGTCVSPLPVPVPGGSGSIGSGGDGGGSSPPGGGVGRLLIVTERCDMDLKEFLQSQPQCVGARDFATWRSLMAQIAGGMAFLHDHGIIHRDLKPGNILVNLPDRVRICDFGLSVRARLQELHSAETHTGFAGTPLYMAPEVMEDVSPGAKGKYVYSAKVDIFAFGVLMNQCWTGRRPYDEVRGPLWKLQRHIFDGGRPLWVDEKQQEEGGGDVVAGAQEEERQDGARAGIIDSDSDDEVERVRAAELQEAVMSLAQRCWAEDPDERPTFHEIGAILEEIRDEEEECDDEGSDDYAGLS